MSELTASGREQLQLSDALTVRTNALCLGLEDGVADILELVTPTTAELLRSLGVDTGDRMRCAMIASVSNGG